MDLPTFWRRAYFSVSEAAQLVGVTEDALRGWLARNTLNDFNGAKVGYRVYLSALDCFYYALVKDLTGFGVGVRVAMLAATQHANDASDELPDYGFLVVTTKEGVSNFALTDAPEFDERSTLVIPLRRLATDLIERAAVVCATAEGSAVKLGTANGRPIAEFRAGIEAELAKMPVSR